MSAAEVKNDQHMLIFAEPRRQLCMILCLELLYVTEGHAIRSHFRICGREEYQ